MVVKNLTTNLNVTSPVAQKPSLLQNWTRAWNPIILAGLSLPRPNRRTILNCGMNHLRTKMRKGFIPKREMSPEISIRASDTGQRYEALLRISEALSACREPEDLTSILSDQLREFLDFFQF
jgi:hypothetical protein